MPGYELFGSEEKKAIVDLLDSNGGVLFAHGFDAMRNGIYKVREFERLFASYMGVKHAQAVSSGSASLKCSLMAAGVGMGDEVIVPAHTFIATVEAILEVSATPRIVDIDETLNICPISAEGAISAKTKAIIPVHMLGSPANLDAITKLAANNNLVIIEDNAQCCGGSYKKRKLGTIGDFGAFSFDAGKTMITGEGGMVLTNNQDYFKKVRAYHDHGHEYRENINRGADIAIGLGFNYRMTELQAAIGIVQLSKLHSIVSAQKKNKSTLKELIRDLPITFRSHNDEEGEIGDALIFSVPNKRLADIFVNRLKAAGIGTKNIPDALNWHFAGRWGHLSSRLDPVDWNRGWQKSQKMLESAIAIPILVKMSDEQIIKIAETIKNISQEIL